MALKITGGFVNPKLAAEIMVQPQYRMMLRRRAQDVCEHANRIAREHGGPWMPRKEGEPIVVKVDGIRVYVLNTDYGAVMLEWGTIHSPPFAPLRRGARAAGLILKQADRLT